MFWDFRQSNVVTCLLLVVAVFAFADGQKSGLYFDATVGAAYSSFLSKHDVEYELNGEKIQTDATRTLYHGFGPAVDVKVGGAGEIFALYFDLQLMYSSGSLEKSKSTLTRREHFEWDESSRRLMLGMGFTAFPFRNPESLMHGSFAGLSLGVMSVSVDVSKNAVSSGIEEQGFSVSIELGKLWTLSDRWSVGVACVGTADGPIRFGEDVPDYYFYTAWLGVKVVRR